MIAAGSVVADSRIHAGVHYLDVLAGAGVGALAGLAAPASAHR